MMQLLREGVGVVGCSERGKPTLSRRDWPAGGPHHLLLLQSAVQIRPRDLHHLVQHPAPCASLGAVAAAVPAIRGAAHPGRGGRARHRPEPHHFHRCGRQAGAHSPQRRGRCLPGHSSLQCAHHRCSLPSIAIKQHKEDHIVLGLIDGIAVHLCSLLVLFVRPVPKWSSFEFIDRGSCCAVTRL